MLWSDKLKEWRQGIPQKYPDDFKGRFFYRTTACKKGAKYKESYTHSPALDRIQSQDHSPFDDFFIGKKKKHAVSFYNLSGDSMMVVPVPRPGLNYMSMKDFVDNASESQQRGFWAAAAAVVSKMVRKYEKVYVNTHGLGVYFFHLRVDTYPKYYPVKESKTASFTPLKN
jgi:hypothetical protein